MRFDDRLLTVLNQPASDRHDVAVRWRQLVDLVARAGSNAASPGVATALDTIRAEASNVDETLRAAAARAVSALPLPLGLLEFFASDSLSVSAPVLAAATLDRAQWRAILSNADHETRRYVEALHPEIREDIPEFGNESPLDLTEPFVEEPIKKPLEDLTRALLQRDGEGSQARIGELPRSEPLIEGEAKAVQSPHQQVPQVVDQSFAGALQQEKPQGEGTSNSTSPSLKDLIDRIERRRRSRAALNLKVTPRSDAEETLSLFRWECGPGGEIAWVDGAPRGALIGRSIARQQSEGARIDPEVLRAFTRRAPFRDAGLTFEEGLMAGEWKISGVPAFEPTDGRFAGYRGIALREREEVSPETEVPELTSDPNTLRELVHEIKTPLNAIIGFAEMIEGQYLGPAERRYRERAQEIVRQARMLLSAIEELDFAAQSRSSAEGTNEKTNLSELVEGLIERLRELGASRGVEIEAPRNLPEANIASSSELAERLVFRMCAATIEAAQAGERLKFTIGISQSGWLLSINRPKPLMRLTEEQLFGEAADFEQAFPLRLVRGLARIAGADLIAPQDTISLVFPRA